MSEVRVRKMDVKLHSKLKIEAIKQGYTLDNLIKKILTDYMEASNDKE